MYLARPSLQKSSLQTWSPRFWKPGVPRLHLEGSSIQVSEPAGLGRSLGICKSNPFPGDPTLRTTAPDELHPCPGLQTETRRGSCDDRQQGRQRRAGMTRLHGSWGSTLVDGFDDSRELLRKHG